VEESTWHLTFSKLMGGQASPTSWKGRSLVPLLEAKFRRMGKYAIPEYELTRPAVRVSNSKLDHADASLLMIFD